MALIKLGAFATDIRGKLAGHTFSNSLGGNTISTKYSGKKNANAIAQAIGNGNSYLRSDSSNVIVKLTRAWQLLSPEARLSWQVAASNFKSTNKVGNLIRQSGYGFYLKINFGLLAYNNSTLSTPPVSSPVFSNVGFEVGPISTSELYIAFNNTGAERFIAIVSLTGNLSPGKVPQKNNFRVVNSYPGNDGSSHNIIDLFVSYYGAPINNCYIWGKSVLLDTITGLYGNETISGYQVGS